VEKKRKLAPRSTTNMKKSRGKKTRVYGMVSARRLGKGGGKKKREDVFGPSVK